jgi:hypothetical protein
MHLTYCSSTGLGVRIYQISKQSNFNRRFSIYSFHFFDVLNFQRKVCIRFIQRESNLSALLSVSFDKRKTRSLLRRMASRFRSHSSSLVLHEIRNEHSSSILVLGRARRVAVRHEKLTETHRNATTIDVAAGKLSLALFRPDRSRKKSI